ncbi:transcriptional regulator TACO1-like protein [Dipodascopsis uninucleata]
MVLLYEPLLYRLSSTQTRKASELFTQSMRPQGTRLNAFRSIGMQCVRRFSINNSLASGHNKWSTIKHAKSANDALKNATAMRHSRNIVNAAKIGGPDPNANARLFSAIEAAKRASVTKRVIENALRRAAGISSEEGKVLESVTYEAVGPGGSALVVEALTDNKARTVSNVRAVITKNGCSLGPAVFYFDRKGVIRIVKRFITSPGTTESTEGKLVEQIPIEFDEIFEHAIDAGAEDIETVDVDTLEETDPDYGRTVYQILTSVTDTAKVAQHLREEFAYDIKEMGIEYIPLKDSMVELTGEHAKTMEKIMSALDEIDDVQDIYTNAK